MIKLLYGTGNQAKIASMKRWLAPLDVELLSLSDMNGPAPEVEELGRSPLENARLKARAYYESFHLPVFSCDSGLYFENVPEGLQPGVHVRVVNGKRLTDEEMIAYYSALARKYGGLTARYWNAVCFVEDGVHVYESMDESLSGGRFLLTGTPHEKRNPGFPLDSLSVDIGSGRYYFDMKDGGDKKTGQGEGFLRFFRMALCEAEVKNSN